MDDNERADRRRPTIPDWTGGQGKDWAPASLYLPRRHGQAADGASGGAAAAAAASGRASNPGGSHADPAPA